MVAVNVAQLLKSPVGTTRDFEFSETVPALEHQVEVRGPVRGRAHLLRIQRGILVEAEYQTECELTCSRCLETFLSPMAGTIEEEFLPRIDILSGEALPAEGEEFRINEDNVLDLTEALRQDILVNLPLQPLCMEGCEGLCPECGAVRNRERCACRPTAQDSPFQSLARLLEREQPTDGEA